MKVSYTINPVENSGFSAVGYEASLPPQAAADLDEPLCIVTDQPIPFEL